MQTDLFALYEQWRKLTQVEGEAIKTEDWPKVDRQQTLKMELKERIMQVTETWQAFWSLDGSERAEYERQFRPVVAELITMEQQNHEILCRLQQRVKQEMDEQGKTARNLRGVQRAYASGVTSRWHSYS